MLLVTLSNNKHKKMEGNNKGHHFVLVHGICHGAWCWYKLIPILRFHGHRVSAVDLAASGVHPKQLEEIRTATDYVQPLIDFLGRVPADEKVVLVGHSYGGLAIALAMQSFPNKYFRRLAHKSLMDCQVTFDGGLENPPTSITLGPNFMEAVVYTHCKLEEVELGKMLT
ncbi:unnamed protein product, partial [Cuscuta epithymum]